MIGADVVNCSVLSAVEPANDNVTIEVKET